jgi:hypothetical protein
LREIVDVHTQAELPLGGWRGAGGASAGL